MVSTGPPTVASSMHHRFKGAVTERPCLRQEQVSSVANEPEE